MRCTAILLLCCRRRLGCIVLRLQAAAILHLLMQLLLVIIMSVRHCSLPENHFDVQVTREQIFTDLATPKFEWDHPGRKQHQKTDAVSVTTDPYEACNDAHGLAVLTEWDEFKTYDFERIYETMMKPAFIFDGRNLLDHEKLREIGFIVYALGKPLDPFIQKAYS